ncbi:MAG: asparagine synthase (glutamine-hydrolyzing) [Candidatus Brocadiia bacterium]
MCGICGMVTPDPERAVGRETLRRMTRVLRHRGPDNCGYHKAPGVALGVCRLSVIDPEGGDQPLHNEDGSLTLVCNGQIYNAPELRAGLQADGHRFATGTDAEVILHLYEEHGPQCISRLRGMFAFALWDERQGRLMLGRDRLGIKPLYYSAEGGALWFGSEMKSILLGGRRPELDPIAVEDLFRFGYVLCPRTVFRGIRHLPPAHYLLWEDGGFTLRRYWRISFPRRGKHPARPDAREWAEALLEKFRESVRIHLRSDVPVAAWLSAGLDSSAVTALAADITGRPIDTFSLTFEESGYDEVRSQVTLATDDDRVRTNRRVHCTPGDFALLPRVVWHSENVSTSGIEIVQQLLARETRRDYKVVLVGEGSDELFGGYGWFWSDKVLRPLARLPLWLRRLSLLGPLMPRLFPRASRLHTAPAEMNLERYRALTWTGRVEAPSPPFSPDLEALIRGAGPSEDGVVRPDQFHVWHPFNQLQYYDLAVRLPGFGLQMLDHSSMAGSVEARVPFLDHKLVEFCAQIPPGLKMRGRREKHVLREALDGVLPAPLVRRPKKGLRAPYRDWLRGELPEFAAEMLSERALRRKGHFDPGGVVRLLQRHRRGEEGCGRALMGCLVVQLVDEIFLSGRDIEHGP